MSAEENITVTCYPHGTSPDPTVVPSTDEVSTGGSTMSSEAVSYEDVTTTEPSNNTGK